MIKKTCLPSILAFCFSLTIAGCAHAQAEVSYQSALDAFRKGDYATAQQQALAANAKTPDQKKVLALLAWSYFKQGNTPAASSLLQRLKQTDPDYLETVQLGAWMAYAAGDQTAAEEGFNRQVKLISVHKRSNYYPAKYAQADVIFLENTYADAHYGLGLLAMARNDMAKAAKLLTIAADTKTYAGHEDVLAAQAEIPYRQGEYGAALNTIGLLAWPHKSTSLTVIHLKSLLMAGRVDEAAKMAATTREQAGDTSFSPFVQALALAAKGRTTDADAALDKAVAVALPNANATELTDRLVAAKSPVRAWSQAAGERLFQQRQLLASGTFLIAADRIAGCRKLVATAWGDVDAGRPADAYAEFNYLGARGCGPTEEILAGLGTTMLATDPEAADALFRRATEANPRHMRAQAGRGAVAYLRQDYPKAIALISTRVPELPSHEKQWSWGSDALNNLAWSYYFTGDHSAAEQTFKRLTTYTDTPNATVTAGLGWVALRQGRKDEAQAAFIKALEQYPGLQVAQSGIEALRNGDSEASAKK